MINDVKIKKKINFIKSIKNVKNSQLFIQTYSNNLDTNPLFQLNFIKMTLVVGGIKFFCLSLPVGRR